jgi:hypothetical protein
MVLIEMKKVMATATGDLEVMAKGCIGCGENNIA